MPLTLLIYIQPAFTAEIFNSESHDRLEKRAIETAEYTVARFLIATKISYSFPCLTPHCVPTIIRHHTINLRYERRWFSGLAAFVPLTDEVMR